MRKGVIGVALVGSVAVPRLISPLIIISNFKLMLDVLCSLPFAPSQHTNSDNSILVLSALLTLSKKLVIFE